jgi:hypothetical protein
VGRCGKISLFQTFAWRSDPLLPLLSVVKLEIIFDYLQNNALTHCVTNSLPKLLEIIFFRPKNYKEKRKPNIIL